mgnify:CR=1 FL=1
MYHSSDRRAEPDQVLYEDFFFTASRKQLLPIDEPQTNPTKKQKIEVQQGFSTPEEWLDAYYFGN